jgi:H/ACA ribonucleoprotein complex subunit 1
MYPAQDDLVVKAEIEDVPYFNAPIYLENKEQIGKIDEIFGNIRDYYVSVKLSDDVKVKSFSPHQKVKIHIYNFSEQYCFSDTLNIYIQLLW